MRIVVVNTEYDIFSLKWHYFDLFMISFRKSIIDGGLNSSSLKGQANPSKTYNLFLSLEPTILLKFQILGISKF